MNQSTKSELLALLLTIKQDLEADSVHQAGLCSQLSARYPEWTDKACQYQRSGCRYQST